MHIGQIYCRYLGPNRLYFMITRVVQPGALFNGGDAYCTTIYCESPLLNGTWVDAVALMTPEAVLL